ncbi:MAG: hypothetical protein IKV94_01225 [Clostridia bacterium]|nr:hypothetical protein [Clostridia bacterium]
MILEKNEINLTAEAYVYVGRCEAEEILKIFKEELRKYIYIIKRFAVEDLKKLSDDEFWELVKEVYSVKLLERDYLKLLSKKYKKEYYKFVEINTSMVYEQTETEGKGKNFSWWQQLYQVRYVVAVSSECKVSYGDLFTKAEIEEKVQNNDIVLVRLQCEPLNGTISFEKENFQEFEITELGVFNYEGKIFGYVEKNENFHSVISLLRRALNKKRIRKDMADIIEELKFRIHEIITDKFVDYYSEISRMCNDWYELSQEKKEVEALLVQLAQ